MSGLHPSARSLIESAKRREAPLPEEVRGRVHRSVHRRAAALAAAVTVTTSTSVAAKAGALMAALAGPLVASATLGGLVGVGFLVDAVVSKPPAPKLQHPLAPVVQEVARTSSAPLLPILPLPSATAPVLPPASVVAPEVRPPGDGHDVRTRSVRLPAFAPANATARAPEREDRGTNAPAASEPPPAADLPVASAFAETPLRDSTDGIENGASARAPTLADPPRRPPISDDLAAELDLLRQVHAALRARQADRALVLLDRYDRTVRAGPLDEEAQAARVSALCQLGRQADARGALARFAARWPGSVLATRLQSGCFASGAPGGD
jgi:hypothetical protein